MEVVDIPSHKLSEEMKKKKREDVDNLAGGGSSLQEPEQEMDQVEEKEEEQEESGLGSLIKRISMKFLPSSHQDEDPEDEMLKQSDIDFLSQSTAKRRRERKSSYQSPLKPSRIQSPYLQGNKKIRTRSKFHPHPSTSNSHDEVEGRKEPNQEGDEEEHTLLCRSTSYPVEGEMGIWGTSYHRQSKLQNEGGVDSIDSENELKNYQKLTRNFSDWLGFTSDNQTHLISSKVEEEKDNNSHSSSQFSSSNSIQSNQGRRQEEENLLPYSPPSVSMLDQGHKMQVVKDYGGINNKEEQRIVDQAPKRDEGKTVDINPILNSSTSSFSSTVPEVVFKESWEDKERRYQEESAIGHLPGWRMVPVIIKTDDDLRLDIY